MKSEGVDAKRLVARHRHNELERRERELRQREVDIRLREMEADIHGNNTPIYKTVKHQPENSRKLLTKKVILAAKLVAIGVAALVAVKIASVVAGIIIVTVLSWISYKLFFDSKKKP
jgi:hypothetical protein